MLTSSNFIHSFRCFAKLVLLYHHQEPIVQNPPVQALQRQKVTNEVSEEAVILSNDPQMNAVSFTLQRSGRVIRKISVAPPNMLREWKPLQKIQNGVIHNGTQNYNDLTLSSVITKNVLIAETLYILKPIIHLGAMRLFGTKTWKPWMIALLIDLAR